MEILLVVILVGLGAAFYWTRKSKNTEAASLDAPYKIEAPAPALVLPVVEQVVAEPVSPQITDAVTQEAAPAKKTRKPRAAKAEKPAAKKAAPKKAAAPKAKKSKKA